MESSNGTSSNGLNSTFNCSLPYENDRLPLLVLYGIVLIVGVPANIVTVYLTFLEVQRKNVLGIYLLSLSVCDLMYLGTLPAWAVYIHHGHHWYLGSLACKMTGYIFFNNMYISIFLLCCVSVDRYIAVVYSLKSRGLRQMKLAVIVTSVVVVVVALGHMPVFTMAEGETETKQKRCFEPGQNTATLTAFNYARFVIGFFIPLCILLVTNRAILSMVQASAGLNSEQKIKVRYLVLAVILFFLVCFAPYHIILLLRAVSFHFSERPCTFDITLYSPYSISLGLSTLNSAMNPILYVLASDNMRKEICRSTCCPYSGLLSREEAGPALSSRGHYQRNCPGARSSEGTQEGLVVL
ncbi:probable G-protein coupled receptor 132 [Pangasianodon hypophthalmus]|uniref:probable G-protein coupled receptor 132 n=1 Tax=Pangasianodon hypophthalmus TaxID=310915 RepID=UPI00147D9027|nr:probable G-protein coupled receptor 132 [Pangasianodon hypophthalmus]XP_026790296.2 probable G-protein coupled receptor 132 [Pangasianodon hypophthalmus]